MTTTTYVTPKPRKKYPRLEVWRGPLSWNVARLRDPIHGSLEQFPTFDNALDHVRHLIDEHSHRERVREMGVSWLYYEPPEPTRGELALYERIYEEMLDETGDEPREQDVWDEVQRRIEDAYGDRGLE